MQIFSSSHQLHYTEINITVRANSERFCLGNSQFIKNPRAKPLGNNLVFEMILFLLALRFGCRCLGHHSLLFGGENWFIYQMPFTLKARKNYFKSTIGFNSFWNVSYCVVKYKFKCPLLFSILNILHPLSQMTHGTKDENTPVIPVGEK